MEILQGCFMKRPKLFFIITPLLSQPKSRLMNALTIFLPYQLLTFGKKAQNIPLILFTLFSNPVYFFINKNRLFR